MSHIPRVTRHLVLAMKSDGSRIQGMDLITSRTGAPLREVASHRFTCLDGLNP